LQRAGNFLKIISNTKAAEVKNQKTDSAVSASIFLQQFPITKVTEKASRNHS